MRRLFAGLLALALFLPLRVSAQAAGGIRIASPVSGDVLQGLVNITGASAVDGFFSSELSFAYASDTTNTWFLIYSTDQPVTDGLLADWDTSLVTDGDYTLRLRVTLQDGTVLETLVSGLRIRNQKPAETATPIPTMTPEFESLPFPSPLPPTPMPAPTSTRLPQPTALPPNPAALTDSQVSSSLIRGILLVLLSFALMGFFLRFRRST